MDGTLIDSAEYHWITWHDTLDELGVALTRESFDGWFGSAERPHPPALFRR